MVLDPADSDHGDVHVRVRRPGQDFHRRDAAVPVLPVRHHALELFQRLIQRVIERVCQQCVRFREGLLPAAHRVAGQTDIQPGEDGHPTNPVHPGVYRIQDCGRGATGLLYSTLFMCITLFLAVIVFNRVEHNFMDTV